MATDVGRQACPVCGSNEMRLFVEIKQVPVHCNLLWPDRNAALEAPKGDIDLGYCPVCGHCVNMAFDPNLMEYNQAYENSLHFSPRFQAYAESLAAGLVERHNLHHKELVELGAGQGDFLRLLCDLGPNYGWGFDAAYVPNEVDEVDELLTFIQDFDWQSHLDHAPDLIYSRHVLEHIERPLEFMQLIREVIGSKQETVVFHEMPNMAYTLRELAIWDIIYEHCGYYSPQSAAYLFKTTGFSVLQVAETYAGQFLTIEGIPTTSNSIDEDVDLGALQAQILSFAAEYRSKVAYWQHELAQWAAQGKRVVAWGAGSKGVTFLNILQTQAQIAYIVDINPRKKGMHVVGSGQEIVHPEFLREYKPDVIILMNPVYKEEIKSMMSEMGLTADYVIA